MKIAHYSDISTMNGLSLGGGGLFTVLVWGHKCLYGYKHLFIRFARMRFFPHFFPNTRINGIQIRTLLDIL